MSLAQGGASPARHARFSLYFLGVVLWLSACSHNNPTETAPQVPAHRSSAAAAPPAAAPASADPQAKPRSPAPEASPPPPAVPEPEPPSLPEGLTVGAVSELPVPGDAPALVVHAAASVRQVAVYLHGVCGDIEAIRAFAEVAAEHFTLVALHADEPCSAGGRRRWTSDTARQERRIDAALEAVQRARAGHLDTTPRLGMGYSQGALRALALHVRAPERYPRLLLGGLPAVPDVARLGGLQALALVTGEREGHEIVNAALKQTSLRGIAAERFILPGAGHGQYGPEAPRVMSEAIGWVMSAEPPAP